MTEFRPRFLTVADVLRLHHQSLLKYGGEDGVRDAGLLESALAQPMAGLGGEYLHPTIPEMAAAYLFHIAKNHPFVDGNKRAAALAAIAFIRLNGRELTCTENDFEQLVLKVASSEIDKPAVAEFFRRHTRPRRDVLE